jgi:hypothetical protein
VVWFSVVGVSSGLVVDTATVLSLSAGKSSVFDPPPTEHAVSSEVISSAPILIFIMVSQ